MFTSTFDQFLKCELYVSISSKMASQQHGSELRTQRSTVGALTWELLLALPTIFAYWRYLTVFTMETKFRAFTAFGAKLMDVTLDFVCLLDCTSEDVLRRNFPSFA